MIDTHLRSLTATIEFDPREWSLLDAEAPHIVDGLLAGVATEDEQMRLREDDRMTISSTWCRAHDWDNHPLSLILAISHIK